MAARTHNRRTATLMRAAMLTAGVALLAGCSSLSNMFDSHDDTILPGKRESVMPDANGLKTDPALEANPVVVPAAQTNSNWAQPGGTPTNSLHNLALSGALQQAWAVEAGEGSDSDGRLVASPIVVGGRIYVLDTLATVRAFNASSGALLWTRSLAPEGEDPDGAFGGGLASDGSRIYATTAFGDILALDANSGNEIWRRPGEVPFRDAPTVVGGRLFASSVNNEVVALSTSDGKEQWTFQGVGEQASVISSTSPAVSNGMVVVPTTSGELIAFRASDGIPRWGDALSSAGGLSSIASLSNIAGRPVIDRGAVFAIAHSGRMGAFRLETGERLWVEDVSGTQTPWVAGDYVFVLAGDTTLAAVSRKDGKARWKTALPSGQVWSGPVMGGGKLILVSSTGQLAQVSPQTGKILSQKTLDRPIYITPVIANNTLYVLTDDATLIALR